MSCSHLIYVCAYYGVQLYLLNLCISESPFSSCNNVFVVLHCCFNLPLFRSSSIIPFGSQLIKHFNPKVSIIKQEHGDEKKHEKKKHNHFMNYIQHYKHLGCKVEPYKTRSSHFKLLMINANQ